MNNLKKVVLLIIGLILFIIFILVLIINIRKDKKDVYEESSILKKEHESYIYYTENPASVVNGNKPEPIQFETVYLTVKNSLKKYLDYCKEDNTKAITSIVDKQYIESNKTSKNTVMIPDTEINQLESLYIEDMYALNGAEYYQYYIKYYIDNNEKYIELNQDTKNNTFSIAPLNKSEYEKILKTVINGRTGKEKEIQKNKYNIYNNVPLKEPEIANAYLEDFKEKLIYNQKRVYEMLDKEFKEINFPEYSKLNSYIIENKEDIKNITMNNYSVNRNGMNRTYTCIDNNNKKYIFYVTSAMKYTILFNN